MAWTEEGPGLACNRHLADLPVCAPTTSHKKTSLTCRHSESSGWFSAALCTQDQARPFADQPVDIDVGSIYNVHRIQGVLQTILQSKSVTAPRLSKIVTIACVQEMQMTLLACMSNPPSAAPQWILIKPLQ
jgi:hypothetical protein